MFPIHYPQDFEGKLPRSSDPLHFFILLLDILTMASDKAPPSSEHVEMQEIEEPTPKVSASTIMAVFVSNHPPKTY
jgi:hypothetical protein